MIRHTTALAALLLALVACGHQGGDDQPDRPSQGSELGARTADFAAPELTWAIDKTLHYGDQSFELPGWAMTLWRTPYGFVVRTASAPPVTEGDWDTSYSLVDAAGTTQLAEGMDSVRISPDGRLMGWIDLGGDRVDGYGKPFAEVVVTDLETGKEVFRNGDFMGDKDDDLAVLYGELPPTVLGFDDDHVYWTTPDSTEHEIWRADRESWTVESGETTGPLEIVTPKSRPYDSMIGAEVALDDRGRISEAGDGNVGHASPNGAWCFTGGLSIKFTVTDCARGRDVTPRLPGKGVRFAGWSDEDSFYALVGPRLESYDRARDQTPARFNICSLSAGSCQPLSEVTGLMRVVLPIGADELI